MTATLLDGKKLAETVRAEVRAGVDAFRARHGRVPGLDVVLVGEDPASQVYTRNKEKASSEVGMRGRLVTKQGQILANALVSGVVSGIGQGVATSSTEYSTSALGTVASTPGADAYRAGLGTGVGRALDRLAQYYIKLAENTFPVIEVDAGREIDVVITKGVRIDIPMASSQAPAPQASASPETRYLEVPDDGNY